MSHVLKYGSKEIPYSLQYANRKTLGITVTPTGEVVVRAPAGATVEDIEIKLRRRAAWIMKQQQYFLTFQPRATEKLYVSGESHFYLGRQYKLRVVEGPKNDVHFTGRELLLTKRPKGDAGTILNDWYRRQAKAIFATLAEPLIQRFQKYNVAPAGIYLQSMPTRWGSCTPRGKIILNPELVKAPKGCIEYVIVHELCHLVHAGHTAAFFKLQALEMPDWEKQKGRLERLLA